MKERPILFSAPMVRAILEGRKTQTRRVITLAEFERSETPGYDWTFRGTRNGGKGHLWQDFRHAQFLALCKYGIPGDRLWVRETFRDTGDLEFDAYKADIGTYRWRDCIDPENCRWKPSIFMPRRLSRVTLEITDVRVQRVQAVSEEDAKAEGSEFCARLGNEGRESHREGFAWLWDSINAKRGFGWDQNPWVWALTFKRVEGGC